ncbi:MAG: DUF973 family protein [Thermoplasmata archaeon]
MAARFCPYCGRPVVPGGAFCASCGGAVGGSAPLPGAPGAPPPASPWVTGPATVYPAGDAGSGVPTPATRPTDLRALENVSLGAILTLVGLLVGFVVLFATPVTGVVGLSNSSGTDSVVLSLNSLYAFAAAAAVSIVFTVLELLFYFRAFRTLAPLDHRFSTPSTAVLVVLVALLVFVVVGIAAVYLLSEAVACAGNAQPIVASCINASGLLAVLGVAGVAGIAALIGYIGLLVGIWRLGTRYHEGLFKASAILLFIPLLNVVAVILILIAVRSTRARLSSGSSGPMFG